MTRTVVALFDSFAGGQGAVQALVDNGIRRDDISLVAKDGADKPMSRLLGAREATGAQQAAGMGAVLGGLAGLLVGLGALAIPGIGPIIAAGPLAAALAGAGVGAITGGLVGALMDAGVSREEAQYYAEGVRRGGTLVVVRATNSWADQARALLEGRGAVDIQARVDEWQQAGWQPLDTDGLADEETSYETRDTREQPGAPYATSPLQIDEQIGPLRSEDPIDQPSLRANLGPAPASGSSAGSLEAESGAGPGGVPDAQAHLGATEPSPNPAATGEGAVEAGAIGRTQPGWNTAREYDAPDDEFRRHYEVAYGAQGGPYDRYEPAYLFGYGLGPQQDQSIRKWSEIEPEARHEWERRFPNEPWDNFKEAVRQGWARAVGRAEGGQAQGGSVSGSSGSEGRLDRPSYQGPEDRRL